MRRSWILAALACIASAPPPLPGGRLDLDQAAPPPALGLDSAAAQRVRALQEEIAQLGQAVDDDAARREGRIAGINLRRVAMFLLDRGDGAGPAGSPAIVAGVCLAAGRSEIDQLLARAGSPGQPPGPIDALRRFNSLVANLPGIDLSDPARLDEFLAEVLRPLAEAAERIAGASTVNHWITITGAPAPGADPPDLQAAVDRVAALAQAPGLDEPLRLELDRIAGFLARGAAFEEFRAQVADSAAAIERGMRLGATLRAAPWASAALRAQEQALLAQALADYGAPAQRPRGQEALARLGAAADLAERIAALHAASQAPVPGRSAPPELDMAGIEAAFAAVLRDDSPRGPAVCVRLAAVIDRMIAYRRIGDVPLPYELQPVWRKLNDSYRGAEAALLVALPRFVAPGGASDPALVSLVDDQRDQLDDLRRLGSMHEWNEAIRQYAPRAAGPFAGQLRRQLAGLGEPARRVESQRVIAELERQLRSCFPMPFEGELRQGDPAAVIATGGRAGELVAVIEQARRDWAEAWAAGAADAARKRLDLLAALARTMEQSAALLRLAEQASVLNRWSAWELDPVALARIITDLRGRLKLATAAAIDGDGAGLAEQAGRLESPATSMVAIFTARLEPQMTALPGGALGTLGQVIHAPPPGAWLPGGRGGLADFCRYTMEYDFARLSGRQDLAAALGKYLEALAGRLATGIAP